VGAVGTNTLRKRLDSVEERIVLRQHRDLLRQFEGRSEDEQMFFIVYGYWPETATELPLGIEFTVRGIKTIVTARWEDENSPFTETALKLRE
jgi:hypothetical protein